MITSFLLLFFSIFSSCIGLRTLALNLNLLFIKFESFIDLFIEAGGAAPFI